MDRKTKTWGVDPEVARRATSRRGPAPPAGNPAARAATATPPPAPPPAAPPSPAGARVSRAEMPSSPELSLSRGPTPAPGAAPPKSAPIGPLERAAGGGVLGAWMKNMLALTKGVETRRDARSAPLRGCGLPPLSDPFWRRPDLATQVLTVLSTLEQERAVMAAQLAEARAPKKPLAPPPVNANGGGVAATKQWPPVAAPQAAQPASPGAAAARGPSAETQRALEEEQSRAREREAKLQSEIDAVMLAGIEALEAKNAFTAEAERLQQQVRALVAHSRHAGAAAAPNFGSCRAFSGPLTRNRGAGV